MSKLTEAVVKAMSKSDLYGALSLIEAEIKEREEGAIAETIREYLRTVDDDALRAEVELGGGVVRATFPTVHWDNGWFYDENDGELTLADGSKLGVDFSRTVVDAALTDLSAVARSGDGLDRESQLMVDMVTGQGEHGWQR